MDTSQRQPERMGHRCSAWAGRGGGGAPESRQASATASSWGGGTTLANSASPASRRRSTRGAMAGQDITTCRGVPGAVAQSGQSLGVGRVRSVGMEPLSPRTRCGPMEPVDHRRQVQRERVRWVSDTKQPKGWGRSTASLSTERGQGTGRKHASPHGAGAPELRIGSTRPCSACGVGSAHAHGWDQ